MIYSRIVIIVFLLEMAGMAAAVPAVMNARSSQGAIAWGVSLEPHLLAGANIFKSVLRGLTITLSILSAVGLWTAAAKADSPDCVILLHGLGRTSDSMATMAAALQAGGFHAVNLDYPSRDYPVEKLATDTIALGLDQCRKQGGKRIHFVTHSLGGILVRYYLAHHSVPGLGRVVMLSPPNQGSEAVEVLKEMRLYQWFFGPAGQQLGTGPQSLVSGLGPVTYPVGVITGNKHTWIDAWLSNKIPGEDDGKVSVQRAKVAGMVDFLVVPYDHTFIMNGREVIEQTIHFLQHGRFQPPKNGDQTP